MIKFIKHTTILILILSNHAFSQTGTIKGRIYNQQNNLPVEFASVGIEGKEIGTVADQDGNYQLKEIPPGVYNIVVSSAGFKKVTLFEIQVNNIKITFLDVALEASSKELNSVEISASPFTKIEESPVSLKTIGTDEIQRNPGGNRDISKVIQSLPGVSSTVSFRNDIIIRGGSPNENRFYLDGVEVPNINHFATQGSSGGPVGMINVNFIREVDFYSGAFPASKGNSLSSILDFKQRDGNKEKLSGTLTVGSSDVGLMMEGPLGKKSTFLISVRRSYLQLLFEALNLPFLPVYNDIQLKHKIVFDKKNQLTVIGLGAIDDLEINKNVNEGETDTEIIEQNNYILGNIPENSQWNYTIGANYKHFEEKNFQTYVISRNQLNNSAYKFYNNDESVDTNKILDYQSSEIENKFRFENTYRNNSYKINAGINFETVHYSNSTFNKTRVGSDVVTINYNSKINFNKYGAFIQASKGILNERMMFSFGIRTDINDYSDDMNNPLDQVSPRFSFSFFLTEKLSFNFNTGRYYQLPPYTVLGYRDNNNILVNKENNVTYINSDHLVAGFAYELKTDARIVIESFYKKYNNYPLLLNDSISLANLGGDFGVIGNEPATSFSEGRSYGLELLIQQKLYKGFYGILAYTFVKSEFKNKGPAYVSSSWDNRHIINLTGGKKFKNNWEAGVKWRFLGGAPYTPYDIELSALKSVWDVTGQGIPDYESINTLRSPYTHSLDIRIDKRYYMRKWSLNVYLDIQNLLNFQTELQPYLNVKRDSQGNPLTDPVKPDSYQVYYIENTSGTFLPSIGIMVEF